MKKIDLIAVGRLKKGPLHDLTEEYRSRLQWPLNILEIESKHKDSDKTQADEAHRILDALKDDAYIVALDERGRSLKSLDFAKKIEDLQNSGQNHIQFILGGADGLTDDVRNRADLLLSFGQQTWPHMLARVMLLEQIYRAQQILKGHPYHRE